MTQTGEYSQFLVRLELEHVHGLELFEYLLLAEPEIDAHLIHARVAATLLVPEPRLRKVRRATGQKVQTQHLRDGVHVEADFLERTAVDVLDEPREALGMRGVALAIRGIFGRLAVQILQRDLICVGVVGLVVTRCVVLLLVLEDLLLVTLENLNIN